MTIYDLCESIQNDLDCILDGLDQERWAMVCKAIADRFDEYLEATL